jgi:glycine/D-amino acid oxidase-like deaminating enzyme
VVGTCDPTPLITLPYSDRLALINLVLATGHFRNGILLAPVSAELIAATVSSGQPKPELIPFSLARFHPAS